MTAEAATASTGLSRADYAYERIKTDIVEWNLAPGVLLSEKQVAGEMEVSRTPVREALQRLAREGLVKLVPGRGAFVSDVSIADVLEIFQLREMLEALASRLAASNNTGDQGGAIPGLISRFESFGQDRSEFDRAAYYRLTLEMDETVFAMADNSRLSTLLDGLGAEARRLRHYASSDTARLIASAQEHIAILEAIAASEPEQAEEFTRAHVRASRENILEGLWRRIDK